MTGPLGGNLPHAEPCRMEVGMDSCPQVIPILHLLLCAAQLIGAGAAIATRFDLVVVVGQVDCRGTLNGDSSISDL